MPWAAFYNVCPMVFSKLLGTVDGMSFTILKTLQVLIMYILQTCSCCFPMILPAVIIIHDNSFISLTIATPFDHVERWSTTNWTSISHSKNILTHTKVFNRDHIYKNISEVFVSLKKVFGNHNQSEWEWGTTPKSISI